MTLKAPDWPRCARCSKLSHPDHRVEHNGRVYCSSSCVEALKESVSQATLRVEVFKRDLGVCYECRLDTLALRRLLDELIEQNTIEAHHKINARARGLKGFPASVFHEKGVTLWQAAHVVARVEGGANDLSNLKTLCLGCHAEDTARLASKRAASRRPERPWPRTWPRRKFRG